MCNDTLNKPAKNTEKPSSECGSVQIVLFLVNQIRHKAYSSFVVRQTPFDLKLFWKKKKTLTRNEGVYRTRAR